MTTINLYKTYSFRNKDPIIDKLRTIKQKGGWDNAGISDASGVSMATLHNWFDGPTRRPQYATTLAVARAMGHDYRLVKRNGKSGFLK